MKTKIAILISLFFVINSLAVAQKFEQPILISSAGQSADVKLVKMLAQKQKLNSTTFRFNGYQNIDYCSWI
jgi:hypothetical protein